MQSYLTYHCHKLLFFHLSHDLLTHSVIFMTLKTVTIPAEEWKVLEQKIKTFNEHVKKFQREVKERLN